MRQLVVRQKFGVRRWSGKSPTTSGGPIEVQHYAVVRQKSGHQLVDLRKFGVRWCFIRSLGINWCFGESPTLGGLAEV
ncbi:hypothetical protein KFK09_017943 [Dendrobium nobile]|uniref:Uncharacterized protein n=1 Tax=Dendrobium nobile TaxID=94219 RepID=A0A8T3AZV2_DENNO|nr:hypothetical protein KFK09_017943 [Dendrobium nobile]